MSEHLCARCGAAGAPNESRCAACGGPVVDETARGLVGQTVLGHYLIEAVLGQGGMSVVYRARHAVTEQQVAVKVLPPELAVHGAIKIRFVEEAKALARLEHASIVRLYNFGEEGGRFFLVMQFVEGKTFEEQILEARRLLWRDALVVGCQVLDALDYAHGQGIVHRDVKPSNILVRPDGPATVMDFGIAKVTQSTRLTGVGQTMGTVRYMSPEQVRGTDVDARSDLYSLAATLFEAITGDTPFDGQTHFDIMSKHLHQAPPTLTERGVPVPTALDAALQRALAKDPAARFQSAKEMRRALAAIAGPVGVDTGLRRSVHESGSDHTVPADLVDGSTAGTRKIALGPGRPWRRGLTVALALLVALVAAAVIARSRGENVTRPAATRASSSAFRCPLGADGWPTPLNLDRLPILTDERFDDDLLRVQSAVPLDVAHARATVRASRERFEAYALRFLPEGQHLGRHRMNLLVVPPRIMCDERVHAPGKTPGTCAELDYRHVPHRCTVVVVKGESSPEVEAGTDVGIHEGTVTHVCAGPPDVCHLFASYFKEVDPDE